MFGLLRTWICAVMLIYVHIAIKCNSVCIVHDLEHEVVKNAFTELYCGLIEWCAKSIICGKDTFKILKMSYM